MTATSGPHHGLAGVHRVAAAVVTSCVRQLPVDGAAVLLMSDRVRWTVAAVTSAALAGIEDLQLTVGEGPSIEAHASGGPVLAPDLLAAAGRWPILVPELDRSCGFFSFPLQIGAVRFGVLDLHRIATGSPDRIWLAAALRLADRAAVALVDRSEPADDAVTSEVSWSDPRIDQATGMTSVHLGVDVGAAYARLRGHAFRVGLPLTEVAAAVVAGSLRLERGPGD